MDLRWAGALPTATVKSHGNGLGIRAGRGRRHRDARAAPAGRARPAHGDDQPVFLRTGRLAVTPLADVDRRGLGRACRTARPAGAAGPACGAAGGHVERLPAAGGRVPDRPAGSAAVALRQHPPLCRLRRLCQPAGGRAARRPGHPIASGACAVRRRARLAGPCGRAVRVPDAGPRPRGGAGRAHPAPHRRFRDGGAGGHVRVGVPVGVPAGDEVSLRSSGRCRRRAGPCIGRGPGSCPSGCRS